MAKKERKRVPRKENMPAAANKIKRQSRPAIKTGGIDLAFLVIVILLLCAGLVVLFSASYANALYRFGDSYYFFRSQIRYAALGLVVMIIAAKFSTPGFLRKMAIPAMIGSGGLLALVPIIGTVRNYSRRWIFIGSISIQPSELTKLGIILLFAYLMSKYEKQMKTFKYGILPYALILLPVCGLLIKQPHLSATILTLGIGAIMMFVGGSSLKWLGGAGGVAAVGMAVVMAFSSTAQQRLSIWLDPWVDPQGDGFQTIQSLYAIGSGGIFGLGLGRSRQKFLYIPEPQNDFIFAIACEELGFFGALLIVLLFAVLIWRGFTIALRAHDKFSCLVIVGITTQVGLQAFLNIAVVTNLVPNTGISLPFFSAGGTSLIILLASMGIVLGLSRYSHVAKE